MSYQSKLESAQAVVVEHNKALPPESQLKWDSILGKLQAMGGTTESGLMAATWEDLEKCELPRILARTIANIFRQAESKSTTRVLTENRVSAMSMEELIKVYDPTGETNPAVSKRLRDLSEDRPFLVFNEDKTVNVEVSLQLLKDFRNGFPPKEAVTVNGNISRTFRVNQSPEEYADENPLYPGEMLRTGGMCDHSNRSWNGVPHRVRQVIYLAVTKTQEIKVTSLDIVHNLLDMLGELSKNNWNSDTVQTRYPKAALILHDLEHVGGSGPSLKIRKGNGHSKPNDPFYGKNTRS